MLNYAFIRLFNYQDDGQDSCRFCDETKERSYLYLLLATFKKIRKITNLINKGLRNIFFTIILKKNILDK